MLNLALWQNLLEFLHPCVSDLGVREVQYFEFGHLLQVLQSSVGDSRAAESERQRTGTCSTCPCFLSALNVCAHLKKAHSAMTVLFQPPGSKMTLLEWAVYSHFIVTVLDD